MPSDICSTPCSVSPLNMFPSPSITCVNDGKNCVSRFLDILSKPVCISCKLSWKAAASFTASFESTPPSSCTRSFIFCVSSADVFRSAPSSVAPRPKSLPARYVLCVVSSTSWSCVMTLSNSSCWLILSTSSSDKPRSSNASLPVSAALASVFMDAFMVSIDVPECCITASHSW